MAVFHLHISLSSYEGRGTPPLMIIWTQPPYAFQFSERIHQYHLLIYIHQHFIFLNS
jgi:hypothetical protein